jgi:L,D-transpeptidase ErfK/SrfK
MASRGSRRFAAAIAVTTALAAVPAAASEVVLAPGQRTVGAVQRYVIKNGDVLPDVARRFDVGYTALAAANPGIDPWVPHAGQVVMIPSRYVLPDAPHRGIVINLAQWRLFYFPPSGDRVVTLPLGLGVIGRKTPLGTTRVVRKEPHPAWYPTPSIRAEEPDLPAVVPAGPDNPLGDYALHLGWKNYLIHGTNKPDGVGRDVSHGCIRLYPEDIARLFAMVKLGTPVRTVMQPATVGWVGDRLYLAVYPSKAQTEAIDTEQPPPSDPLTGVRAVVRAAAGEYDSLVDWEAVDVAARARTGMAVLVADRAAYDSQTGQAGGATPSYDPASAPGADPAAQPRDQAARAEARADRTADPAAGFYDGATPMPFFREFQYPQGPDPDQ